MIAFIMLFFVVYFLPESEVMISGFLTLTIVRLDDAPHFDHRAA
jgi:hypothetical protein